MKNILFLTCLFLPNLVFAQIPNFNVIRKVEISGNFIVLIEYNDSIIWENNRILYSFCAPKDSIFDDNYLHPNEMQKDFIKLQGKIENYLNTKNFNYYGLFYDYLFKYQRYAYQKSNLDSCFIADMEIALLTTLKDTFDFFVPPCISGKIHFGLYVKSIKIACEGYLVSYPNFNEYLNDFISTTNDIRNRKLVGIRGNSLGASLYEVKDDHKGYVVFIPTKVISKF
jgi:hypothetical protein